MECQCFGRAGIAVGILERREDELLPILLADIFKVTPRDGGARTAGFVLLAAGMRPIVKMGKQFNALPSRKSSA